MIGGGGNVVWAVAPIIGLLGLTWEWRFIVLDKAFAFLHERIRKNAPHLARTFFRIIGTYFRTFDTEALHIMTY